MDETAARLDVQAMLLGMTAGLALFLYGVGVLSEGLQAVAGERMKRLLARATANRFAAVASGAVATTILDSSSAVTILVVGLVGAKLLDLGGALGVILGANIGTTVSSQLFALDVMRYAPVALGAGFLLGRLGRSEGWKRWGDVILALGLIFFGLEHMSEALMPLRDYAPFLALMERMENRFLGALVGAGVTALIQSSSATLGILIQMAKQGSISLKAGVAMMMGAEVGTCLDTMVATVGQSRDAVRAGVFQLAFNLASVALFIGLADPLAQAAAWISEDDPGRQLANAHVLFNVASVLVFLGFVRTAARILTRLIPDRGDPGGQDP